VVLQTNDAPPAAPSCDLPGGFPLPAADALQRALTQRISAAPGTDPTDLLVPLARIDVANQAIDMSVGRPLVYSNRLLYELILCLSDRLAGVAQARVLRYVSGDAQRAGAGQPLANKLIVQLVDGSANAVQGQTVQFQVSLGGGSVQPASLNTDANGNAQATWTLGNLGPQQLIASAAGSAFTVTFNASATSV
jgi:hypothetical protein